MKQTTLRVYWADYLKIRKIFPAMREESVASYFRRFALWLKTRGYLYNQIK